MQGPKKTSRVRNRSNHGGNLTGKWAVNEQNAQPEKKLYNKISHMPSKSSVET